MQGKSKYYFPNNLLFAALANILGRANQNIIFPPILRTSGFFGFREVEQHQLAANARK